jgi:hypothetical protein
MQFLVSTIQFSEELELGSQENYKSSKVETTKLSSESLIEGTNYILLLY